LDAGEFQTYTFDGVSVPVRELVAYIMAKKFKPVQGKRSSVAFELEICDYVDKSKSIVIFKKDYNDLAN
jgi:hypothetical protein